MTDSLSSITVPVITLLITVVIAVIVANQVLLFDVDRICTSEYGTGWEHVDGPDDDITYCQAPNGSVEPTVVHMGAPIINPSNWPFVAAMAGLIAASGVVMGSLNGESR